MKKITIIALVLAIAVMASVSSFAAYTASITPEKAPTIIAVESGEGEQLDLAIVDVIPLTDVAEKSSEEDREIISNIVSELETLDLVDFLEKTSIGSTDMTSTDTGSTSTGSTDTTSTDTGSTSTGSTDTTSTDIGSTSTTKTNLYSFVEEVMPVEKAAVLSIFDLQLNDVAKENIVQTGKITFTFAVEGIKPDDKVVLLHFNTNKNEWESVPAVPGDGIITAELTSASPFMIIVEKEDVTSPDTADTNDFIIYSVFAISAAASIAFLILRKHA